MPLTGRIFLILIIGLLFANLSAEGFLKRDGRNIVDGNGQKFIIRAMGLGGWMLQEGYMLQTAEFASPEHKIRQKIQEVVGAEKTELFYNAWHANHCRKADVDSLAAWGFNAIRLPMHYKLFTLPIEDEPVTGQHTWLDKGFQMVDDLLQWCAENKMYLILDLHGAPGGQGMDAAISDYDNTKPSLWESHLNKAKTVALWRKLAERYANEPWIGGYDLINETNWNMSGNAPLRQLYEDITTSIRAVDTNHIIFIEGNWFANDFTGLTPPWDDNMVYSFHKYWSHNNQASIQWVLNLRTQYNIPLWCGEAGENSNVWFTDAIRLLENNDIGWAWWPMKKVESISAPLAIIKPAGYQKLLDYWGGKGAKPSVSEAETGLMDLAENARIENCVLQPDVIDAMIRQVQSTTTVPYSANRVPGTVYATDYDLGRLGYAYHDTEVADYHVSTGTWTGWNNGWAYRNDGVDIQPCNDKDRAPYNVGWIEKDEWLNYTINAGKTDYYNLDFRVSSANSSGLIRLIVDNKTHDTNVTVSSTGGWQIWGTITLEDVYLSKGIHTIKLDFLNGGFNLSEIGFRATGKVADDSPPASLTLRQNYPNPFNAGTHIPFVISEPGEVRIFIYDIRGRLIVELPVIEYAAGEHAVPWDGRQANGKSISSGIYFYRCQTSNAASVKSMLYMK